MQITVASIQNKPKRSIIETTDGRKLGVWTDKLGQMDLVAGGSYEIETQAHEMDNGKTLTNIVKAKSVAFATSPLSTPSPAQGEGGCGKSKDEQIFVQGLLQALIKSGQIKNDKTELWTTTQMLRGLWRHTFGFVDPAPGMQAAE